MLPKEISLLYFFFFQLWILNVPEFVKATLFLVDMLSKLFLKWDVRSFYQAK